MIYAGTGHRPNKLGGYSKEAYNILYDIAFEFLNSSAVERVISGMALGWDTALAEAAIDSHIKLTCAIPFRGQEGMWPLESQNKYREIRSKADEIIIVCEGGYASWKMQTRNIWMTDNCDKILAMYNGDLSGGTYNCIKYAEKQRKEIINLYNKL